MTTEKTTPTQRVIGLDSHPDTFTAALLQGQSPASAVIQKMFDHVPLAQLQSWAKKHTTPEDLFVLEASGNSFQVVRLLAAIDRQALVLESCHLGKLKIAHANNDKISAVRIAKAYLAGTDSGLTTRTWQQAMETLMEGKQGANRERWSRVATDRALAPLLPRTIVDTPGELMLKVLQSGTVSTNVFLRRLHNFCLDMNIGFR